MIHPLTLSRKALRIAKIYGEKVLQCIKPSTITPPSAHMSILNNELGLSSSITAGRPVAADGSPIPWYTYPAIEYLNQLNAVDLKIFEYGCGNSSLYWARKGAHVWSVEHSSEWHEQFSAQSLSPNNILLRQGKHSYAQAIHEQDEVFDIIIIDGVWRNDCCREALKRIRHDGIIILDNSDWYADVAATLRENNLFQIDFNGFGPINNYCWTTSIFLPLVSHLTKRIRYPVPIGGITTDKGEMW